MPLHDGDTILNGKYHILRMLGEGGQARVWLAEEPNFGNRQVAIKEPRHELVAETREEIRLRYQREVQVCAMLDKAHVPNIVRAITVERLRGTLLLVLDYMAGGDVARLIKDHPAGLPIDQALAITLSVLRALNGAHEHDLEIIHRDVKPSNILLDHKGSAYLSDFGLAQVPGWSEGRSRLEAEQHPGSFAYMAPEQETSRGYLTPSADLFALGCVLFEMVTGKRYKRLPPGTTASSQRAGVPAWLDALLARALAEDRWQRYQSAADMAAAIEQGQAAQQAARSREQAEAQRKAEEERARLLAAEEAKRKQEEDARRAAEEAARRAEEERLRREAERREREEAETRRKKAEEARQAQAEADERARLEAAEQARQQLERQRQEEAAARRAAEEADLARLFDQALAAERAGALGQARDVLAKIVARRPNYYRGGQSAGALLRDINRRLAPKIPKRALALAVLASLIVAAVGVAGRFVGGLISGSSRAPIKLAIIAPLTGDAASFGQSSREGDELAIREWNDRGGVLGRRIEWAVADSRCDAQEGAKAANKVISQDKVGFIVADTCSTSSITIAEVANAKSVIQIVPNSTNPRATLDSRGSARPYTFRACFIDQFQGTLMANFAYNTLKAKTAAVVLDQGNDYVRGLAGYFKVQFEKNGGKVTVWETYTKDDTDFSAILSKVAAAKVDFFFIPDYYNKVSLIAKQAKGKGITAPMGGGDGWDSDHLDYAAVDGGYYINHYDSGDPRPIVASWSAAYGAAYKDTSGKAKVPDAVAALAYDATNLLLTAIQNAGSTDPDKVRAALERISFEGVTGKLTFDAQHNPIKSAVVIGVKSETPKKNYVATVNP